MSGISVLIEGLDGVGKSTTVTNLESKLITMGRKAEIIRTPPSCLAGLRKYCTELKPELREGFYMAGNYLASEDIIKCTNDGKVVIIDRYYPSTMAYILGKNLEVDFSRETFDWPEVLVKPTHMFLLCMEEDDRIRRLIDRGNCNSEEILVKNNPDIGKRINEAYIKYGCTPIRISNTDSPDDVVNKLIRAMNI